MKVNRSDLLDAISLVKPALAVVDFIPVMTHFWFDKQTVTAYNDALAIQVSFDSPWHCAVPGDMLPKILSSMNGDDVELTQKNLLVKIAGDGSEIELPVIDQSKFLWKLPEEAKGSVVFKVTQEFLSVLQKCVAGVSKDATRQASLGVTLDVIDGEALLYSTDNVTISHGWVKVADVAELKNPIIIPAPFCESLIALAKSIGDDEIALEITDSYVLADVSGGAFLHSKLIAAQPYDFEKVIEGSFDVKRLSKAMDFPTQLLVALKRVSTVLSREKEKEVVITLEDNYLDMKGSSAFGKIDEQIPMMGSGGGAKFKANPDLLSRGAELGTKILFEEKVIVFIGQNFYHLISHNN